MLLHHVRNDLHKGIECGGFSQQQDIQIRTLVNTIRGDFNAGDSIQLLNYFKSVRQELEKVTWPSLKKTSDMTLLVLVVTAVWGLYVWLLDLGFGKLMSLIIR